MNRSNQTKQMKCGGKAKKMKKGGKTKSSVESYLEAQDAAKWADEFAGLTSKKAKNTPPHMSSNEPRDIDQIKKYGKWAQEEAEKAHKARRAASKSAKEGYRAGGTVKMKKGGQVTTCRGMGAASRGGKFSKSG